jgi:hypothetical protein
MKTIRESKCCGQRQATNYCIHCGARLFLFLLASAAVALPAPAGAFKYKTLRHKPKAPVTHVRDV